ncbi:MAG: 2-oxoacid:ferredoxin oxidoreductase subunit beta [Planctomycetota bacterium]
MAASPKTNHIGLPLAAYRGAKSTLCKGCGHDVIANTIVSAFYDLGIEPHRVAKLSGIGCSSKTPAYFLGRAWGFNAVHGRMPSVATGALLANRDLVGIGVSGDGDTASIGIGQFVHTVRRNLPLVYVVENNGVYGLTKGQFSATADQGSRLKNGREERFPAIDVLALAVHLGATYAARSFSADRAQLLELLKGAIAHPGLAVIDVLSPCVTFNNHAGSTRSYDWGRSHQGPINEVGFVPAWEHPEVGSDEGKVVDVPMPDGGMLRVRCIGEDHDPRDKQQAFELLARSYAAEEYLTGLYYLSSEPTLHEVLDLEDEVLATLPESRVRPPREALAAINDSFR